MAASYNLIYVRDVDAENEKWNQGIMTIMISKMENQQVWRHYYFSYENIIIIYHFKYEKAALHTRNLALFDFIIVVVLFE